MRPVRLLAEGFAAYRDLVVVDFTDVDFFALVGPTGSGKSSVIDAICFALYGSVPRYDNRHLVAPAITVGASEAKVSLVFDVAAERYQATRVVRRQRNGGATTKEARLERLGAAGGEVLETLAGNADEVSEQVQLLLGLSFDHFTRCVVLPQGEFARFLHDRPADRQQLLASLLDIEVYARMGRLATRRAELAENRVGLAAQHLERLAGATPEARLAAEQAVAGLENLGAGLRRAEPEIEHLEGALAAARAAAEAASGRVAALAHVALPPEVKESAAALEALDLAAAKAATELAQAEAARHELEQQTAALPERAPLERAREAHHDLARLASDVLAAASALRAKTAVARERAEGLARAAEEDERAATAALDAARDEHAAAHLAAGLALGTPCPVCRSVVSRLPDSTTPPALDEAEDRLVLARRAAREATEAAVEARTDAAEAEWTERLQIQRRDELLERIAEHPDPEGLAAAIAALQALQDALAAARAHEDAARTAHRKSVERAASARSLLARQRNVYTAQRDAVGDLRPPAPTGELLEDWSALVAWAEVERPAQVAEGASAEQEAKVASAEREEQLELLRGTCRQRGVEAAAGASLGDLRSSAAGALATARALLHEVERDLLEADRLRGEVANLAREAAVARMLANHLRATGFERWLVAEALDLLVEGASDTLRRLSGGQYSLARDERNEFLVVDHRNADEQRPAKTLSGGETFQASLALALALADQLAGLAAGGAAKLESIFLDEGFGTLDPEALAVVADTIEALGSDERLVGIVTHVRELAERVPVRFEVTKNARTSIVERRSI